VGFNTYHQHAGERYIARGIPGLTDLTTLDYAIGGR